MEKVKMNIQKETDKILGQRTLPRFNSKQFVDLAVNLLSNGYETDNIVILAGMDYESTEDREKYFWKSIEELKIEVNKSDFELIEIYAIQVVEDVCNGHIKPVDGFRIMQDVIRATDYDSKFYQFYLIDEDYGCLENNIEPIFNPGLTKDNKVDYVKKEFQLFYEFEKLNLKESLIEQAICNSCGEIVNTNLKTKYQLKSPFKYRVYVCSNCNSENIEHFSSQIGRRKIVDKLKNLKQLS